MQYLGNEPIYLIKHQCYNLIQSMAIKAFINPFIIHSLFYANVLVQHMIQTCDKVIQ